MDNKTRRDFRWLTSPEAAEILDQTRDALLERINIVRIAKSLRSKTTVDRAAMIIEQAQLRARARKKFPFADQMFFTRKGLEQSTGYGIASYKAKRFDGTSRVADVCCGIGGDLLALCQRGGEKRTVGIDADELTCLFAKHNVAMVVADTDSRACRVRRKTFADLGISQYRGVHIDPDRRSQERTTVGARFNPSLEDVFESISNQQNVAIKVAPATRLNNGLPPGCHREWIGDRRECKQQVIWSGPFVDEPAYRSATCVDRDGDVHRISIAEDQVDQTIVLAKKLQSFVFEPHPAVIAAGLTDALATQYEINRFSAGIAYLTGERDIRNPLLSSFEIMELLPVDVRHTVGFLRRKGVGSVEIKNRGIENVVVEKFKRMKLSGDQRAVLILTRIGNKRINIVALRSTTVPETDGT